jgi:hypothetical protein
MSLDNAKKKKKKPNSRSIVRILPIPIIPLSPARPMIICSAKNKQINRSATGQAEGREIERGGDSTKRTSRGIALRAHPRRPRYIQISPRRRARPCARTAGNRPRSRPHGAAVDTREVLPLLHRRLFPCDLVSNQL